MTWSMFVERWPGGSNVELAPSADRLKTLAAQMWKGGHAHSGVSKMRFTIFDPRGDRWQVCERVAGGSWRARWIDAAYLDTAALLKGDAE